MKLRSIISILSIEIILGFIIGLIASSFHTVANNYVSYRMFRLLALTCQENWHKYIILTIVHLSVISFLLLIAVLIIRIVWRSLFSRTIEIHVRDTNKMKCILAVCIVCVLFFFYIGWFANHYLLPHRFSVESILFDISLLIALRCTGLGMIKLKWEQMLIFMKGVRKTAVYIILFIIIIDMSIFIDTKINVKKGPNVILIMADTLRADHLSCYGYSRRTSPNIDKLSLDSILFENAISVAPWTTASVSSVMTAQYPKLLGIRDIPVRINCIFPTLAEIFKENGYKTEGIISNTMISSALAFDQGFDHYDEKNARRLDNISSSSVTDDAISYIKKHKKDKFFLFLFYFDPHYDYILHEQFNYYPEYNGPIYSGENIKVLRKQAKGMSENDIEYVKALYDSEISFTDEHIGRLLNKLKELDIYDKSMIIFTADHGEEFCERGNHHIGHTKTLYQEQIHVPLLIKLPGNQQRRVVKEYFGLINIMPTILDYLNLKIPDQYSCEGEILDIGNNATLATGPIISETERWSHLQAVIWDGHKFIYDFENDAKKLYDLRKDRSESIDIAESDGRVEQGKRFLKSWNRHMDSKRDQYHFTFQQPAFSEEQKENLRALGYIE